MTPTETREILSAASGDRVASRLVASWASSLAGYSRAEVKAAVDAFIARTGQAPRPHHLRAPYLVASPFPRPPGSASLLRPHRP